MAVTASRLAGSASRSQAAGDGAPSSSLRAAPHDRDGGAPPGEPAGRPDRRGAGGSPCEPPLAEQDRARAHQNPFREHREIAVGEHASIAAAKGDIASAAGGPGIFAVHEKLGVVGPLKLPAARALNLGRPRRVGLAAGTAGPQDDALYAATPDGALHRAAGVHDALRPDGFAPRSGVAGATAWDAAGGLVAAAAGERVSVSADEGRSFTAAVVAPGKRVRAVLVRPHGVLAAVVEAPSRGQRPGPPDTFLSLDCGQTWKRSAFQPRSIAAGERAGTRAAAGARAQPAAARRGAGVAAHRGAGRGRGAAGARRGALLAISPAASAGGRLELALERPARPVLSLVRDVEVDQNLTRMEVRDDGRVWFRVLPKPAPEVPGRPRLPPPGPRDARWHELTRGGELVVEATETPAGPAEERRVGPAGR
ncbi:hypothetical protein WME98_01070 [Sorangium sp. So ce296]|uniref:hypothetical protein n=1 Tax=Sorangium sp. So ce296 TaxID=3133296 RepID=UPI003F5ECFD6